jgi:hypothetical protein
MFCGILLVLAVQCGKNGFLAFLSWILDGNLVMSEGFGLDGVGWLVDLIDYLLTACSGLRFMIALGEVRRVT